MAAAHHRWFSGEAGQKGAVVPGQLADLAVLSADYFSVPEEEIKRLESILTLVGGRVVYGAGEFARWAPPPLPVMPEWSPVATYGRYASPAACAVSGGHVQACAASISALTRMRATAPQWRRAMSGLWEFGCDCFAF